MSLRLKLLLPLVVACLAAVAYLEFVWSPHTLETQKRQYFEEVARHIDTVVEGVVPPMLTGQLDVIRENLDELKKKAPEWTFIRLTNARGQQLYPPLLGEPAGTARSKDVQVVEKDIRMLDRILGKLVVHVDHAARMGQMMARHRQLTLLLISIILLLAVTWVVTLETTVVRRLQRVSAAAGELAQQYFDTPLPDAGKDEVGMLIADFAAMRDSLRRYQDQLKQEIEQHKIAEEKVSALNATLERRVVERTAELERALKDMEAFSYSVSHDLRAPLRAINGFSRMLMESEGDKLSPEGRQTLDRVASNAIRLGQLIDDILNYSRSRRVAMRMTEVDLAVIARKAAADLAEAFPTTKIDIQPLPKVLGDGIMLGQVMQNLIGNACKFSAKRECPLVSVGCSETNGETVFFVRDNGVGFDMRYADKLFGMFQRLHPECEFHGTGVGLAIVHRLIERHGGRIWAEAEPDKGATFRFTLGTGGGHAADGG